MRNFTVSSVSLERPGAVVKQPCLALRPNCLCPRPPVEIPTRTGSCCLVVRVDWRHGVEGWSLATTGERYLVLCGWGWYFVVNGVWSRTYTPDAGQQIIHPARSTTVITNITIIIIIVRRLNMTKIRTIVATITITSNHHHQSCIHNHPCQRKSTLAITISPCHHTPILSLQHHITI